MTKEELIAKMAASAGMWLSNGATFVTPRRFRAHGYATDACGRGSCVCVNDCSSGMA